LLKKKKKISKEKISNVFSVEDEEASPELNKKYGTLETCDYDMKPGDEDESIDESEVSCEENDINSNKNRNNPLEDSTELVDLSDLLPPEDHSDSKDSTLTGKNY
jgi:hypothetical protein